MFGSSDGHYFFIINIIYVSFTFIDDVVWFPSRICGSKGLKEIEYLDFFTFNFDPSLNKSDHFTSIQTISKELAISKYMVLLLIQTIFFYIPLIYKARLKSLNERFIPSENLSQTWNSKSGDSMCVYSDAEYLLLFLNRLGSTSHWLVSSMPFWFSFHLPVLFINDYFS